MLLSGESMSTVHEVNYQLLAVMQLKSHNVQLPVVVDHSQLHTMASETVDLTDWPLPPTLYRAVPNPSTLQAWVSTNGVLKDCMIKVQLWCRILLKY